MSILIAIPGNSIENRTVVSLFDLGKLLLRNQIDHALLTLGNSSLITAARSSLSNFFIQNSSHEYILFLDSDIRFEPADVLKLMSYQREIVCGDYPCKILPLTYTANYSNPPVIDGNLRGISSAGIGFCLIHRSVFEKIAYQFKDEIKCFPSDSTMNYTHNKHSYNNYYHYFLEKKEHDHFLSEDRSFFKRAVECGIQPWVDTTIKLTHTGLYEFGRQGVKVQEQNPFTDLKGLVEDNTQRVDNGKFIE